MKATVKKRASKSRVSVVKNPLGWAKYRYFTDVAAQLGNYRVLHQNRKQMRKYRIALSRTYPYFREIKSGKLLR